MENWLRCTVSPGQFPGEFAVTGQNAGGGVFSLFVPEEYIEYREEPPERESKEAWLRVTIVQRSDNLFLVRLPRQTLENGQFVIVAADQFRQRPILQEPQVPV